MTNLSPWTFAAAAILITLLLVAGCKDDRGDINESAATAAVAEVDEFYNERQKMVDEQLSSRGINNDAVLEAMRKVHRHKFVPKDLQSNAYDDGPLPIGYGQTISQPYIVALMTQELQLEKDARVLEIGTGSGYQAAILAEIVKEVYTAEIVPELASVAEARLKELGYKNVEVKNADGYFGWEENAPFDAVMITAAVNHVPPPLMKQLKEGGKLILPLGSTAQLQTLTLVTKKAENKTEARFIIAVRFVPFVGKVQEAQQG